MECDPVQTRGGWFCCSSPFISCFYKAVFRVFPVAHTMPSLRRTTSSPNVRTSPYSSSARSSHPGRRASGGSDTARRRVLADMDWWAVLEGQSANRPVYTTTTTNDHNENHIFVPHTQQFNPETAPEPITRPTTPAGSSVNTFESRITASRAFTMH